MVDIIGWSFGTRERSEALMNTISNQRYLQFMQDIFEVSQACETTTYAWGWIRPGYP